MIVDDEHRHARKKGGMAEPALAAAERSGGDGVRSRPHWHLSSLTTNGNDHNEGGDHYPPVDRQPDVTVIRVRERGGRTRI
jgi:hypothetical protein